MTLKSFIIIPHSKKIIRDNNNSTINNQGTNWIVSADAISKIQEKLEVKAIMYSSDYSKKLSKLLHKECVTKNISLSDTHPQPIILNRATSLIKSAQMESIQAPTPTKEDATISYLASYIFICE